MPDGFEKTADGQLKVITTEIKEETHSLDGLINWKNELTEERDRIDVKISEIDTLISEAKKLGIEETKDATAEVTPVEVIKP